METEEHRDEFQCVITSRDKWIVAIILGFVFLILVSPLAFQTGNRMLSWVGMSYMRKGKPTGPGWILHCVLFIIFVRLLMR